ncbi:hypothetical protein ACFODZ_07695 [Marinicella sediminis]|uniref:Uncharacterized protein n=1 Tax=Marinicella sediminis TaxID=1792834 RepID=A0ABV7J7L0_9GAMM|nr:hypothetical protein [Marinicella sediminis]
MKTTTSLILLLLLCSTARSALHLNPDGLGQVLIFPYYSVNNGLDTVYTITNTTADTKAIKVKFIEGDNGLEVLDFNVYLDAYDSWSGALVPTTSTIGSHTGEPTALHVSNDQSCVPFLVKSGQEFLPFTIDQDPPNTNMQRTREGTIEVIEMATFAGPTQSFADHGTSGVPANCASIQADWADNNIYDFGDEDLVSGGLMGHASLINVAEGLTMDYQAIALNDFWVSNVGNHAEPGSLFPSLAQADLETDIIVDNQLYEAFWPSGAEAVSAVLSAAELINEYEFNPLNFGQSEWVISMPTKLFHTNTNTPIPPFSDPWDGTESCENYTASIWDRDQQQGSLSVPDGNRGLNPQLCLYTNVIQILPPGTNPPAISALLGSHNVSTLNGVNSPSATDSGWARLTFDGPQQRMTPLVGDSVVGLPMVGFQIRQFTNQQAQPDLIAQYGQAFSHKYVRQVEVNP